MPLLILRPLRRCSSSAHHATAFLSTAPSTSSQISRHLPSLKTDLEKISLSHCLPIDLKRASPVLLLRRPPQDFATHKPKAQSEATLMARVRRKSRHRREKGGRLFTSPTFHHRLTLSFSVHPVPSTEYPESLSPNLSVAHLSFVLLTNTRLHSRGNIGNQGNFEVIDENSIGSQKYNSGELKRVLGYIGNASDNHSFGASHWLSPPAATEELRHYKSGVLDGLKNARERSETLGDSIVKLDSTGNL